MIFIGLGSNVGDRKQLLRKAYDEVSLFAGNLKISSLYESQALLPKDAPKSWDKPFYNMVLGCEVSLNPLELLVRLKAIEKKLGRKERGRWAPREIDLDILFFKDECFDEQGLKIPHPSLLDRPFVIKPLLEIAGDMQFPLPGNYFQKTLRDIAQNLPLNESSDCVRLSETILTPDLVGILNVTPDSFSDGDHFLEKNLALAHSEKLILQGARIIDVGAESTRPGAIKISQKEEWFRLEPILENILALKSLHPSLKVSLDTRHWETAERGLKLGVDIINDVSGVSSEEMLNVLAKYENEFIFMHHLGIPPSRENVLPNGEDPTVQLLRWCEEKVKLFRRRGIDPSRLIFDPGIGFGKTIEQNFFILKNAASLHQSGLKIMIGHSRKSFLNQITSLPPNERDLETLSLSIELARSKIHFLRIHQVDWHHRALKAQHALEFSTWH